MYVSLDEFLLGGAIFELDANDGTVLHHPVGTIAGIIFCKGPVINDGHSTFFHQIENGRMIVPAVNIFAGLFVHERNGKKTSILQNASRLGDKIFWIANPFHGSANNDAIHAF